MTDLATADLPRGLTVEAFLAWVEGQTGRYELVGGQIVRMPAERFLHNQTKFETAYALRRALEQSGLEGQVIPDGFSLRIDDHTLYEPDCALRLGPPLPPDRMDMPDPLLVVEAISPGSRSIDTGRKLVAYQSIASIHHYLILDTELRRVVHHRRRPDGTFETAILAGGPLRLDPPGLLLEVERLFPPLA